MEHTLQTYMIQISYPCCNNSIRRYSNIYSTAAGSFSCLFNDHHRGWGCGWAKSII